MSEQSDPNLASAVSKLSSDLYELFTNGNYHEALDGLNTLAKLGSGKFDDAKLQHNVALTRYYLGDCTEPKKLLEDLAKIKKKIEEKSAEETAGEQDPTEAFLISYNMAVVNLQMKQYASALSILEVLYQNIEPIDESLSSKICFLLLDLYFVLKQKDKMAVVIAYLEKSAFPPLAVDDSSRRDASGNDEQQQPPPSPSSSGPTVGADEAGAASAAGGGGGGGLGSSGAGAGGSGGSGGGLVPVSVAVRQYKLFQAKAKQAMLCGQLSAAKQFLKQALAHAPNQLSEASTRSTFLRANLEYLRRNYTKSLSLLYSLQQPPPPPAQSPQSAAAAAAASSAGSSSSSSSSSSSAGGSSLSSSSATAAAYFNNLACVHVRQRKYAAAAFYQAKALQLSLLPPTHNGGGGEQQQQQAVGLPAWARAHAAADLMAVNQAVQQLHLGQPHAAFHALQYAVQTSGTLAALNPRLWLRMAECCVAVQAPPPPSKARQVAPVELVGGQGRARRYRLAHTSSSSSSHSRSSAAAAAAAGASAGGLGGGESPSDSGGEETAASAVPGVAAFAPLASTPSSSSSSLSADAAAAATAVSSGGASLPTSSSAAAAAAMLPASPSADYGLKCVRNALYLLLLSGTASSAAAAPSSSGPTELPGGPARAPSPITTGASLPTSAASAASAAGTPTAASTGAASGGQQATVGSSNGHSGAGDGGGSGGEERAAVRMSAQLDGAYLALAAGDWQAAIGLAQAVLQQLPATPAASSSGSSSSSSSGTAAGGSHQQQQQAAAPAAAPAAAAASAAAAAVGVEQQQQRYLASVYLVEALCATGRSADAAQYLAPLLGVSAGGAEAVQQPGGGLGANGPYQLLDPPPRCVLYCNLATVYILKEDLVSAQQCVTQALAVSRAPGAVLLQIYLLLRAGNAHAAGQLVHQALRVAKA